LTDWLFEVPILLPVSLVKFRGDGRGEAEPLISLTVRPNPQDTGTLVPLPVISVSMQVLAVRADALSSVSDGGGGGIASPSACSSKTASAPYDT
jgi:hypothetical protein